MVWALSQCYGGKDTRCLALKCSKTLSSLRISKYLLGVVIEREPTAVAGMNLQFRQLAELVAQPNRFSLGLAHQFCHSILELNL